MAEFLGQQIEWIVALQKLRTPGLDSFFSVFTDFGGRHYLWLVPALLWCVDFRLGVRVMPLLAFTLVLNTALKEWIAQPRPFQMDVRVVSTGEQGYGLPSGHAQLVVIFWGTLAERVAFGWFWELAVAIMFLMGLSRVYLGVHFPSDVLAGWALGALTLWIYLRWRVRVRAWIRTLPRAAMIALVCGGVLWFFGFRWVHDEHFLMAGSAGFVAGAGVGSALTLGRLQFRGHGAWWRRVLRYLLGMTLTLGLIVPMREIGVPSGAPGSVVVALYTALLGGWLSFAMPWLFEAVNLGDEPVTPQ